MVILLSMGNFAIFYCLFFRLFWFWHHFIFRFLFALFWGMVLWLDGGFNIFFHVCQEIFIWTELSCPCTKFLFLLHCLADSCIYIFQNKGTQCIKQHLLCKTFLTINYYFLLCFKYSEVHLIKHICFVIWDKNKQVNKQNYTAND